MPVCMPLLGVARLGDISNCVGIVAHCIWYVVNTGTRVSALATGGAAVGMVNSRWTQTSRKRYGASKQPSNTINIELKFH